jgi:hypothetical protein
MQRITGPGVPHGDDGIRIAVTADHHVGNHKRFGGKPEAGLNRRCREHIAAMNRAALRARERQCCAHLILGDVFDHEKPTPQMEAAVQRALVHLPHVCFVGNHDQNSGARGDHAIAPLAPVATIVEEPTALTYHDGDIEIWCVPFLSMGEPASKWLPGVVADLARDSRASTRILMLHMGIADADTPPWLTRGHNWIHVDELDALAHEHVVGFTISGDWHEWKQWDRESGPIVQCGALVPTGFDNSAGLDLYGSLYIIDASFDNMIDAVREIVPGPRFVKSPTVAAAPLPEDDSTVYLEVVAHPLDLSAEITKLAELKQAGVFVDGEIKIDKRDIEDDARAAARSARAADKLDEAVVRFIEHMPMDELADRARVLDRVQRFLA